MRSNWVTRIAAAAAVTGALAQLLATLLESDWGAADSARAAGVVAAAAWWDADRVVDLIGTLLTVAALTVVDRRLVEAGSDWPRLGQPFLYLMGGLGGAAIATGAALKDAATGWQHATTEAASAHLVSFDTLRGVTENLFFVAFLCLGVYLAVLCVGVLTTTVFARWMGACAGLAGVLILLGNLLSLAFDDSFVLVLAGFALFLVVVVALGISLWRVDAPARAPALQDRGRPVGRRS